MARTTRLHLSWTLPLLTVLRSLLTASETCPSRSRTPLIRTTPAFTSIFTPLLLFEIPFLKSSLDMWLTMSLRLFGFVTLLPLIPRYVTQLTLLYLHPNAYFMIFIPPPPTWALPAVALLIREDIGGGTTSVMQRSPLSPLRPDRNDTNSSAPSERLSSLPNAPTMTPSLLMPSLLTYGQRLNGAMENVLRPSLPSPSTAPLSRTKSTSKPSYANVSSPPPPPQYDHHSTMTPPATFPSLPTHFHRRHPRGHL